MSLSRGQQYKYFALASAAYAAEKERNGDAMPSQNQWRRELQVKTIGRYSTKEMNKTTDFDKMMLEFAIMANHAGWLDRLSSGAERRLRHIIRGFLKDLSALEGKPVRWSYIRGICKRMNIPDQMKDCPAPLLQKVLQAVDTHIRRLAKRQNINLGDLPSRQLKKEKKANKKVGAE